MGLKSLIGGGLLALTVGCSGVPQTDQSLRARPGYDLKHNHTTVRFEGETPLQEDAVAPTRLFGYADIDATKKRPLDSEHYYTELTLDRLLGDVSDNLTRFGGVLEYNGGSDFKDLLRLGVSFTPDTGETNRTYIKLLPFETSGDFGSQLSVRTNQKFDDNLTGNLRVDYNFVPSEKDTVYTEANLDYKLTDKTSAFIRATHQGDADGIKFKNIVPVVGVKVDF